MAWSDMANVEDSNDGPGDGEPAGGRIARLTSGQIACLRLVDAHLSSKEIAARLNISPHTVDQRVRQALHILGVERRAQAARMVAQHGGDAYQRLIHQSPYIEAPGAAADASGAIGTQIRHADRAGGAGTAGFLTEQRSADLRPFLQLPFATRSNPRNEMSVGQRLFWIAAIAMGAAFSAGRYLAGLESLSRLLSS
ncbi:MAG: helix-turn-helix transcriptional regulator [Sphingomicrobium sp.]